MAPRARSRRTGAQPTPAPAGGHRWLGAVGDFVVSGTGNLEITDEILAQLKAINPAAWAALGNGQDTHELVKNGTGRIDLRQLGLDLSPGTHTLTFAVDAGGGQIHYNLYVN